MPSTEKIPFEQLPQTVLELKQEISGLKTLITGLIHNTAGDNTDQWMNIDQLRSYHPDYNVLQISDRMLSQKKAITLQRNGKDNTKKVHPRVQGQS